jgi:hypothetical protein
MEPHTGDWGRSTPTRCQACVVLGRQNADNARGLIGMRPERLWRGSPDAAVKSNGTASRGRRRLTNEKQNADESRESRAADRPAGNTQCRPPHSHPQPGQATPTHPTSAWTPRQDSIHHATTVWAEPGKPVCSRKPAGTRTAARSEQQHRSIATSTQTAGGKRQPCMHVRPHHEILCKAARSLHPPNLPHPRSPTRTERRSNQHTAPPHPPTSPQSKLPQFSHLACGLNAPQGTSPLSSRRHQPDIDGAHGNTCEWGIRKKGWFKRNAQRIRHGGAACHIRGQRQPGDCHQSKNIVPVRRQTTTYRRATR